MTADRLRDMAGLLSNGCWCRYWLHWNHPQEDPWLMALSLIELREFGVAVDRTIYGPDFEKEDFRIEHREGLRFLVIPRTNPDGSPFSLSRGHRETPA